MSKYRMAQASAWLNLVGAFLVFLSFQATSSDFFLINLKNGNRALCVGTNALILWTETGVGMGMPHGCADVLNTPRVAIVTIESPIMSLLGWGLLLLGFLLQLFSLEQPPLTSEDLRILRKARKIIDEST